MHDQILARYQQAQEFEQIVFPIQSKFTSVIKNDLVLPYWIREPLFLVSTGN